MDVSILREKISNLTLFDDELMTLAFHNQCELTQILLDAICPGCVMDLNASIFAFDLVYSNLLNPFIQEM